MKKHETVQEATAGQMKEFAAAVIESLPPDMTTNVMQGWIGKKGSLKHALRKALMPPAKTDASVQELIVDWEHFYKKHFDLAKDFSSLRIPEKRDGFDRLIVVAEGMTSEKIFGRIKSLMLAWKYWDNLDDITSDRKADKDYCIWV
ncbi:MAG: hypothetical protein HYT13_02215, partial [Candidatus Liptonbacteria bacterium]|nr:hypothetical protein [Candidatus Liptonbacteria bacterium]